MNSRFSLLVLVMILSSQVMADKRKLGKAIGEQLDAQAKNAESQVNVDGIDAKTQELLREYRLLRRKIRSTKAYNEQLKKLIVSQDEEKVSVRKQISEVNVTNQEILPLMVTMVKTFRELVDKDVPFLPEEREQRAQELESIINRADVSTSEKFRTILEAYQIENEYGRTLEAYRSVVTRGSKEMTVDFLRVGRISFLYQTLDGQDQAIWDQSKVEWTDLDSGFRRPVRDALRVARKQAAPDVLPLPLVVMKENK